jgi:peptidoglycan/xylan/chitin deacetylase (PgdA/CDA1 family)
MLLSAAHSAVRTAVLRGIALGRWRSSRLVILFAHDVAHQAHTLCVPVETFAAQMRALAEDGWRVTTLADALASWDRPGRRVALCFDDGFEGVLKFALPVLDRHGFRATVFACTGWLGRRPSWDHLDEYHRAAAGCGRSVRLMTHGQLAELHARGWEIGAHTVTHPDLRRLSTEAARAEIVGSRLALEAALGAPVTAFAYPYGYADRLLAGLVVEAGFTVAVGTRLGHACHHTNRLLLPRVPLFPELDPPSVRAVMSPLFPAYLAVVAAVRRSVGLGHRSEPEQP